MPHDRTAADDPTLKPLASPTFTRCVVEWGRYPYLAFKTTTQYTTGYMVLTSDDCLCWKPNHAAYVKELDRAACEAAGFVYPQEWIDGVLPSIRANLETKDRLIAKLQSELDGYRSAFDDQHEALKAKPATLNERLEHDNERLRKQLEQAESRGAELTQQRDGYLDTLHALNAAAEKVNPPPAGYRPNAFEAIGELPGEFEKVKAKLAEVTRERDRMTTMAEAMRRQVEDRVADLTLATRRIAELEGELSRERQERVQHFADERRIMEWATEKAVRLRDPALAFTDGPERRLATWVANMAQALESASETLEQNEAKLAGLAGLFAEIATLSSLTQWDYGSQQWVRTALGKKIDAIAAELVAAAVGEKRCEENVK